MVERDKVSGFRLPQRTLDQLDELVALGVIKNRTQGIKWAVNSLRADNRYDFEREPFLYYLNKIVENEAAVKSFKHPDAVFPVRMVHGLHSDSTLDRITPNHANIRFQMGPYGNTEIIIDIRQKITIVDNDEEENK